MLFFLFVGLSALIILFFVSIKPLLLDTHYVHTSSTDTLSATLPKDYEEINEALKSIADLELDYRAGKLSDDDYRASLNELKQLI